LFVSAVGVTPAQFPPATQAIQINAGQKGGPDFSCFLISRACHDRFQFDEAFTPCFLEDLDYHRRLMLAGEGARIFGVALPYLHYGSMTLKTIPNRAQVEAAIVAGSRAYYRKKWGGDCNQETFLQPFGGGWSEPAKVEDGTATTPYLQAHLPSNDPRSGTISSTMESPIIPNLIYDATERDREEQCE
jgi:hypothetical protein